MMRLSRIFKVHINQQYKQQFIRYNSVDATKNLVHLNQRTLLSLSGEQVPIFLQGLITNDVRHLEEGSMNIFSVFLNNKGRVLYDTIIYKAKEQETFYVECDSLIVNNLFKHLKMYKLRKKVNIQIEDTMKVWSVYDTSILCKNNFDNVEYKPKFEGRIFPCGSSDNKSSIQVDDIYIYSDPRIFELGYRILTKSNVTHNEIIKYLNSNIQIKENDSYYRAFRYKLGIAEGVKDLPPGISFPLEINCDYLHGVSFHKGCYIGQELTARTHHTGIVRKRLMPLLLKDKCNGLLTSNDKVINDTGKIVGKIVGQEENFVLGLIRIAEALSSKTLTVRDCTLKLTKPHWWPQDSQKIEATINKS